MTLYLLHADRLATLASYDPVIPAAEVTPLRDATAALAAASATADEAEARTVGAIAEGRTAGHAEGYAAGLAAGEADARATLFDLSVRAAADRQQAKADVSRLALEVVRRIATDVGEPALVAGLAERAVATLLPDGVATVRVADTAVETVASRLAAHPGLTVVGDPALGATECMVETPLGISHAGLEIQLAAINRAWAAAREDSDGG